jgi:hypothetical protein
VTTVAADDLGALGAPRGRGRSGRLEVWYLTFTDEASGLGGWVHLETVAPTDGTAARVHGWTVLFPTEAAPILERFGPGPAWNEAPAHPLVWCELPVAPGAPGAAASWTTVGPGDEPGTVRVVGEAGALGWHHPPRLVLVCFMWLVVGVHLLVVVVNGSQLASRW